MGKVAKELMIMPRLTSYLKTNPHRLSKTDKEQFLYDLEKYLNSPDFMTDEIYDFLLYENLLDYPVPRYKTFLRYIDAKYPTTERRKILDVGAGRMCEMSQELAKRGHFVTAIDPKIQLTNKEADEAGIKKSRIILIAINTL